MKTAFLSGDPQCRDVYFKPPDEIREWMGLSAEDLLRLEKAAYGLAEAPRAWFLRLKRELLSVGLVQSQLDPCLFTLHIKQVLKGVCGVRVDDILGGGEKEMDHTIRYTGIEIRQNPLDHSIEVGQETYIESLGPVSTKPLGTASTKLTDKSILRTCAGQLAWVANHTRAFLQGAQEKGTVAHVTLHNKTLREMKENKLVMKFPSHVPITKWRIVCATDARKWGVTGGLRSVPRASGPPRAKACSLLDRGLEFQKVAKSGKIFSSSRNSCRAKWPRQHRVVPSLAS